MKPQPLWKTPVGPASRHAAANCTTDFLMFRRQLEDKIAHTHSLIHSNKGTENTLPISLKERLMNLKGNNVTEGAVGSLRAGYFSPKLETLGKNTKSQIERKILSPQSENLISNGLLSGKSFRESSTDSNKNPYLQADFSVPTGLRRPLEGQANKNNSIGIGNFDNVLKLGRTLSQNISSKICLRTDSSDKEKRLARKRDVMSILSIGSTDHVHRKSMDRPLVSKGMLTNIKPGFQPLSKGKSRIPEINKGNVLAQLTLNSLEPSAKNSFFNSQKSVPKDRIHPTETRYSQLLQSGVGIGSANSLYKKIVAQNADRLATYSTNHLLKQNRKLFEKKKQAFKGNLL